MGCCYLCRRYSRRRDEPRRWAILCRYKLLAGSFLRTFMVRLVVLRPSSFSSASTKRDAIHTGRKLYVSREFHFHSYFRTPIVWHAGGSHACLVHRLREH